ncbi:MAG: 3-hydroxy-fatty acyl-ACP dehydratase [Enterobacteriaceae bacterium]
MSDYLQPGAWLPHTQPMLLLEEVLEVSEATARCRVTLSPQGVLAPFLNARGELPAWYALELMAQTVGVWSGWHRRQRGEQEIALGMLLGARDVQCAHPCFSAGAQLDIAVNLLIEDGHFGSFEAEITCDGESLAKGRINTFLPDPAMLQELFDQGNRA